MPRSGCGAADGVACHNQKWRSTRNHVDTGDRWEHPMRDDCLTVGDLEVAAEARNYQNWMLNRFRPYLGQRILDAGAGIGAFTEHLLDRELVVAAEGYAPFVEVLHQRLGRRLQVDPIHVDLAGPAMRDLAYHRFDTVLCVNVLEHIEDDRTTLANFSALLQPGGRLVLFVPAHMFLYGTVDRQLGHWRRYTRAELREKLAQAGFGIEHLSAMNVVGTLGWFLNNRVRRQDRVPLRQIALYDKWIVPVAERIERVVRPPIGLSILAVGRKGQN
jgi:SAM-dependent methyltransferase